MLNRRSLFKKSLFTLTSVTISSTTVAKICKQDFINIEENSMYDVINAGVGGINTIDLLARIDKDCLVHQPKLTVLMVGTNDMNSVKYIPIATYEKNLENLIKKIKQAKSKVLLLTILPLFEPYLLTRHPADFYQPEGVSARRTQLNDVIKSVAIKNRVELMDLGHRFATIGNVGKDKDSFIQNEANTNKTDGIHPTPVEYKFIALSVYDYIIDHQLPKTGIVCFGDSITKGDGTIDRTSYPAYLKKLLKDN